MSSTTRARLNEQIGSPLVGLAIAVVLALAFNAVVLALIDGVVMPLIAALALIGAGAWYFLRQRPRESYAGGGSLNAFDSPAPAPRPPDLAPLGPKSERDGGRQSVATQS